MRLLRWAVVVLVAVGGLAFLAFGANGPEDPTLLPVQGQVSLNRTPFGDFGEIGFRIEGGTAEATAMRCALLAEKKPLTPMSGCAATGATRPAGDAERLAANDWPITSIAATNSKNAL